MRMVTHFGPLLVTVALSVCGCTAGLFVPDTQDILSAKSPEEADENLILNQIKCELHVGLEKTLYDPRFYPASATTGKNVEWLRQWGAKVSYVLTVDEKSSLNPGVSFTDGFKKPGTFFSIGGGIQSSAESQQKRTGAVTYAFADLLKEKWIDHPCTDRNGILIYSDLGIDTFISDEAFLTRVPGTVPDTPTALDSGKPQVLSAASDEITFTVIFGGSLTPTWKFARLTVNPSSPLVSATRTKTQYASITLGPVQVPSSPTAAAQLAPEAQSIDMANIISHAIATAPQSSAP